MKIYPFGKFTYGLITKNPPNQIPDGAASDSLNWITNKGKIQLNKGYAIMGTKITGSGSRTSGLRVGQMANGNNVAYATYDQKVRYYNDAIGDWTEVGSDLLPLAAKGEDITMSIFESPAGKQLWLNSPNTGPIKFNLANPGDSIAMYDASKNYKGWMRIYDNQAYLWNIDSFDKTTLRLSYIEVRGRADYTQVVNETVTNGAALSVKAGNPKGSFLDVSGTGGVETFTDDLNGVLVGASGGTGTINYQTGVISFTPAAGAVGTLTVTYRWIDELTTWTPSAGALSGSLGNFVVPASRVSGQPNVFQQARGGNLYDIQALKDHKFCFHRSVIFDVLPSLDDTKTTNTVFRDNIGIQRLRGAITSPEGIYAIDTSDAQNQRFVVINYSARTPDIKPTNISPNIDLTDFVFDKAVAFIYQDYVLFSCRTSDSPDNNRTFIYHRIYHTWDLLDYCVSCYDVYNGNLIGGDSLSPNVQTLFSGFDADGDPITNQWVSGISRLGFITGRGLPRTLYGQKKAKKLYLEGYIAPDQTLRVYTSIDRGAFVEVTDSTGGPFIKGSGSYVDKTQSITIGSDELGDHPIGAHVASNTVEAYHYARYLDLSRDRFEEIQIKFVADGIGYLDVIRCEFRDIRVLQNKPSLKYRG